MSLIRTPAIAYTFASVTLLFLLFVNMAFLLTPKLLLIEFFNSTLWGGITKENFFGAIAQDLLICVLVSLATLGLLRKPTKLNLLGAVFANGFLLLFLMIDIRVRELWLESINVSLIRYALTNASDLTSGADLFFNRSVLYNITYRKLLFAVGLLYLVSWGVIGWMLLRSAPSKNFFTPRAFSILASGSIVVILVLSYGAITAPQYRYHLNENPFIGFALRGLRTDSEISGEQQKQIAESFEQKLVPLNKQFDLPRTFLQDIKPFQNVVVVIYESMRWRDINILGEGPTNAPVLADMASTGMVSKSFVSVPHSSKAYFAVLTGRHPYLGIEMREVLQPTNEAIWHGLKQSRQLNTYAFSSMFLGFEGMGKLLKSIGFEAFEARDMAKASGLEISNTTSFGTSDEHLYALGGRFIEATHKPFAAVFFPMAAHYPYNCAGADTNRHDLQDYSLCVKEADANLGKLLSEFRQRNLMADTLFVVVGDHGESFGEHGLFVHNSSMYQEETTVPLVFWSEDGRLGHRSLSYSRQIDIAPTIADLMGALDLSTPVQGISLLRRQQENPPVFMSTFFDGLGLALYEQPYKYILEPTSNTLTAFNLESDPQEISPVAIDDEKRKDVIQRVRAFQAHQQQVFKIQ